MHASKRPAGPCIFCLFRTQSTRPRRAFSTTSARLKANPRLNFESDFPREERGDRQGRNFRVRTNQEPPPATWSKGIWRLPLHDERADRLETKPRGIKANQKNRANFPDALAERKETVKADLEKAPIVEQIEKDGGTFKKTWASFERKLFDKSGGSKSYEFNELQNAFRARGASGLEQRLKYEFYAHVLCTELTKSDLRNQEALADMRYPTEWFPATRKMLRTVHLHVGPTNSGKTYHALQRLEQANTGVYAGPLRLLAHEIYTRLNAKGRRCILVTGDDRRTPDDSFVADMASCTVEMMPMSKVMDVAVIDEIQMIANSERGWAWTQALLGVQAKELHLCGEARTVPLIKEICAAIGDEVVVHEYERLSPLGMASESLSGNLKKLRKGDCIVSFSIVGIHALRTQIEKVTGKKVATVYGSLPPETRAQQARLFNDPDNDYDFLVASDAIGMGLNLSIKRVIFESATKFDGYVRRPLAIADIKQIGGRAGRYRTAHQDNASAEASATSENVAEQSLAAAKGEDAPNPDKAKRAPARDPNDPSMGMVTTLERFDFPMIEAAMKSEPEPIKTAGIYPPSAVVEKFASYFPPYTPFSFILQRMNELAKVNNRYHICGLKDQLYIADLIEPVKQLTVNDRLIFTACPAGTSGDELNRLLVPALARCVEQQGGGALLDIEEMPLEVLEEELSPRRDYLRRLEMLHKGLTLYLWLSYRFAGIFTTRPLAFHVKSLVEEKIEKVLNTMSFTEGQRRKIAAQREKMLLETMRSEAMAQAEDAAAAEDVDGREPSGEVTPGDRFGGEADTEYMEPIDVEESDEKTSQTARDTITAGLEAEAGAEAEDKGSVSSFAAWRQAQMHLRDEDEGAWDRELTVQSESPLLRKQGVDVDRPLEVGQEMEIDEMDEDLYLDDLEDVEDQTISEADAPKEDNQSERSSAPVEGDNAAEADDIVAPNRAQSGGA